MSDAATDQRWENMLAWLNGHGADTTDLVVECRRTPSSGNGLFARRPCPPGGLLFSIPAKAMMNLMTLRPRYPRVLKNLTAIQLISMHLFIWRPKADDDSKDPLFGPYISTLPRDFTDHPLSWFVQSKYLKQPCSDILQGLPPSVFTALDRVYSRFLDDWFKVHPCLIRPCMSTKLGGQMGGIDEVETVMDFLWAWLSVNTRCIYYRLKTTKSDPDNLAMCPILDFANHSSHNSNMRPGSNNACTRKVAGGPSMTEGLRFFLQDDGAVQENDEILLTYGLHSNKTLFVEYGFVNMIHVQETRIQGEVDVQDVLEEIVQEGQWYHSLVKEVLVNEGYWGDWVIFSTPESAQPSWRLVAALRLYHLVAATNSADESAIQAWRDVIAGRKDSISESNEQACRASVLHICEAVIDRAERSLETVVGQKYVRTLWIEELVVARAVKASMCGGEGLALPLY